MKKIQYTLVMDFEKAYYGIGRLDRLSYHDTVVHRLDPRTKVIIAAFFIIAVVSYPKYEVAALIPFFLFPTVLAALGEIPVFFLLKKILIVSPFAILIGIANPLFDNSTFILFGKELSAGWLSFCSIIVKFTLTIGAALLLIATTSFPAVCRALRWFGFPALFISQLLFLYRYLFVLMEEVLRVIRARDIRSFDGRGTDVRTTARIVSALFIRTIERAERVYSAMISRGFNGDFPLIKQHIFRTSDLVVVTLSIATLILFRFYPITTMLGGILEGAFR